MGESQVSNSVPEMKEKVKTTQCLRYYIKNGPLSFYLKYTAKSYITQTLSQLPFLLEAKLTTATAYIDIHAVRMNSFESEIMKKVLLH